MSYFSQINCIIVAASKEFSKAELEVLKGPNVVCHLWLLFSAPGEGNTRKELLNVQNTRRINTTFKMNMNNAFSH